MVDWSELIGYPDVIRLYARGELSMSSIESNVTESRVFPPSDAVVKKATISGMAAYEALCKEADKDHAAYWARLAREHVS